MFTRPSMRVCARARLDKIDNYSEKIDDMHGWNFFSQQTMRSLEQLNVSCACARLEITHPVCLATSNIICSFLSVQPIALRRAAVMHPPRPVSPAAAVGKVAEASAKRRLLRESIPSGAQFWTYGSDPPLNQWGRFDLRIACLCTIYRSAQCRHQSTGPASRK